LREHLLKGSLSRTLLRELPRLLDKARSLLAGVLGNLHEDFIESGRDLQEVSVKVRTHRDGRQSLIDELRGILDFGHRGGSITGLRLGGDGGSAIWLGLGYAL